MNSDNLYQKNFDARQPPEFLAVGRVVRPHGIRGAMILEAFSDLIQSIKSSRQVYMGLKRTPVVVRSIQPYQSRFLLELEGCKDRDTAEIWRDEELCIRFEEAEFLPEGVYYHWQILDLHVFTTDGEYLGVIQEIYETGANDIYLVRDEQGAELLLPAIESVIVEVDLGSSRMVVRLLPGLRPDPTR